MIETLGSVVQKKVARMAGFPSHTSKILVLCGADKSHIQSRHTKCNQCSQ